MERLEASVVLAKQVLSQLNAEREIGASVLLVHHWCTITCK
jgi:hypothetical protein